MVKSNLVNSKFFKWLSVLLTLAMLAMSVQVALPQKAYATGEITLLSAVLTNSKNIILQWNETDIDFSPAPHASFWSTGNYPDITIMGIHPTSESVSTISPELSTMVLTFTANLPLVNLVGANGLNILADTFCNTSTIGFTNNTNGAINGFEVYYSPSPLTSIAVTSNPAGTTDIAAGLTVQLKAIGTYVISQLPISPIP